MDDRTSSDIEISLSHDALLGKHTYEAVEDNGHNNNRHNNNQQNNNDENNHLHLHRTDSQSNIISWKNALQLNKEESISLGKPIQSQWLRDSLEPHGNKRKFWNWLILLLTIYNAIFIPLAFFESSFTRHSGFLLIFNFIVDAVFILDTILNFFAPYMNEWSTIVWDHEMIKTRYIHGYFLWDFLAAIPFDYFAKLLGWGFASNAYQVSRINRICRMHRLYTDPLLHSKNVLLRIIRLSLMLLMLCHWAGSLFFALGYYQTEPNEWTGEPWTIQYNIQEADFQTQYISSVYFSIVTVLTVGFGDITPRTNVEKACTSIAILIGSLFYAVIFGNVALLINNMNFESSKHRLAMDRLEAFMKQYHDVLPKELRQRLRRKMTEQWKVNMGIQSDDVLNALPQSVRADTLVIMRSKLITASFKPFRTLSIEDFDLVRELVLGTYSRVFLTNECIYRINTDSVAMGFINQGMVKSSFKQKERWSLLKQGSCFGGEEMILGVKRWSSMYTCCNSEIIFLGADHYKSVLQSYTPGLAARFRKIARETYTKDKQNIITERELNTQRNWNILTKMAKEIGRRRLKSKFDQTVRKFLQAEHNLPFSKEKQHNNNDDNKHSNDNDDNKHSNDNDDNKHSNDSRPHALSLPSILLNTNLTPEIDSREISISGKRAPRRSDMAIELNKQRKISINDNNNDSNDNNQLDVLIEEDERKEDIIG